ncbi:MAG: class I SAM-dependent methyltransferase [Chloroflexota bacterium]
MSDFAGWLLMGLAAAAIIALGWWLLIESEGVYLGRRVVIWLYDLYADRYDDIKRFRPDYDYMFLAQPIMERIAPHRSPLVLDVATGTGRLPLAMLDHALFQGRVIGVDMSRRMLSKAAAKLEGQEHRVALVWSPAEQLPFPDASFDVVTCLEALEFMTAPERVLGELARVLRPGGLLLITNRINTRLMPGKTFAAETLVARLEALGLRNVEIEYWQVDYDRVWACKEGVSQPTGARPLAEVLSCPRCGQLMVENDAVWRCPTGHFTAPVGRDGVVEML